MTRRIGLTAGVLVGVCAASWFRPAVQSFEVCSVPDVTPVSQDGTEVKPELRLFGLLSSSEILYEYKRVRKL